MPRATTAVAIAALWWCVAAPFANAADETAADPLLAPPGLCAHDANLAAHHGLQRVALHCLVRYARRHDDLPTLRSEPALRHSAIYKARRIAACRVFTHAPCGDALSRPFLEAHVTRHGRWMVGENLAWGVASDATPRAVVEAWLASPAHRRVLLDDRMTHLGVRRRRLRMRGAPAGAVLWVAHLGHRAGANALRAGTARVVRP